jgi:hypothetical protein
MQNRRDEHQAGQESSAMIGQVRKLRRKRFFL